MYPLVTVWPLRPLYSVELSGELAELSLNYLIVNSLHSSILLRRLVVAFVRAVESSLPGADGAEMGRAMLLLQPAFKTAVARPRPGQPPGDAALHADLQHSRSGTGGVAFESRVQVVGETDVMLGVAQGL